MDRPTRAPSGRGCGLTVQVAVVTSDSGDDALQEFLADAVNKTEDLALALARCAKALGPHHAVAHLADLHSSSGTWSRSRT